VTREAAFLWEAPGGPTAVYLFEGTEAAEALDLLGSGENHFDDWLRTRLAALHTGLDVPRRFDDTRLPPGAWRGLRRLRGWRR
jgi:hypothetical protein